METKRPKLTFENSIRFTPYAWAKLIYMRDKGDTEVAGYCTTATDDPLLITDFRLVRQQCTGVSFDLDPESVLDDIDRILDSELMPWQTHNILAHTHPGNSPYPSITDENNFEKAFSSPDWAIMFIIAEGGQTYCRIKANVGPGVARELATTVDWTAPFEGADHSKWDEEYKENVFSVDWQLDHVMKKYPLDMDDELWNYDNYIPSDNSNCYLPEYERD